MTDDQPHCRQLEKSLASTSNHDMLFSPLQGKKRENKKAPNSDSVTLDLLIVFTTLEEKASELVDSELDQTQLK